MLRTLGFIYIRQVRQLSKDDTRSLLRTVERAIGKSLSSAISQAICVGRSHGAHRHWDQLPHVLRLGKVHESHVTVTMPSTTTMPTIIAVNCVANPCSALCACLAGNIYVIIHGAVDNCCSKSRRQSCEQSLQCTCGQKCLLRKMSITMSSITQKRTVFAVQLLAFLVWHWLREVADIIYVHFFGVNCVKLFCRLLLAPPDLRVLGDIWHSSIVICQSSFCQYGYRPELAIAEG